MKLTDKHRQKDNAAIVNILIWIVILCLPYLAYTSGARISTFTDYLMLLRLPLTVVAVYYANYYFLVQKFLLKDRLWLFIGSNVMLIVLMLAFERITALPVPDRPPGPGHPDAPVPSSGIMAFLPMHFLFVNTLLYLCALGAAVVFRMIGWWYEEEKRRTEQEHSHVRVELQNLKNQLNPHFLFNTLNNIYSYIGTDADHARHSLDSLCELLRYALYRSERPKVHLQEEVDFIRDYISLAGERLPEDTDLSVELPESPSDVFIAPMLFIVPVENAFKYGVKAGESSFIHISLKEQDRKVICNVENSYYTDSVSAKSADAGIGIENMCRRLEILYNGHYTFRYGVMDNEKYYSYLEIELM